MPFWKGDAPGRPLELGRALGAFLREVGSATPEAGLERARAAGLDEWGAANLQAYLAEQKAATGHLPDDRTLLVERFRDELGDWRLVVHSPFGAQVNAPWALVLAARLRERYGVDVASMHSDDGIVLRLPDTTGEPPDADLALLDPDDVEREVTAEVGGSALFAARFRECAARALLLPRRDPRKRTPLWQQRQRAAQLLSVASEFASFPITLEAAREVLQDVYDVPGLVELMRDVRARRVRVADVQTQSASPFAQSLLFGYVGQFLYEGDAPLAERRAQSLALDTGLLAELLGRSELRELLDAEALAEIEAELQRRPGERHPRDVDGAADLLRFVGDLTPQEAAARGVRQEWLDELVASRRAIVVRIAGEERHVAIEDAGRLRDALGPALPVGVPEVFTEPVADPLGDLVGRYARTHGPFQPAEVATRLGLGVAVVTATLQRLTASGRLVTGEFRPGGAGQEWCDAEVLRSIRRRSLARLRQEVEPVPIGTLARFTPSWQSVGSRLRGPDGVLAVVEQLAGALVPASALESLVLPARVRDYAPAMLDELTSAGEVLWAGAGGLPGGDGWISLVPADIAPLLLPEPLELDEEGGAGSVILEQLGEGQALFFRGLSDLVGSTDDTALAELVWDLVWSGRLTNDTLAPLRTRLAGGGTHKRAPAPPRARLDRTRYGRTRLGRPAMPTRTGPPTVAGRWSLLPRRDGNPTKRTTARAEALLERHGVLTRGAVMAEQVGGGFSAVYPVLRAFEENGRARRGYFVETLGAAQFGTPGSVDRLRSFASPDRTPAGAVVLAATDPANVYGAALPWPERPGGGDAEAVDVGEGTGSGRRASGHRAGRKAGALVVLVDGDLVLYVERGGRTLLSWTEDEQVLKEAATALSGAVAAGALGRMVVQKADGASVHESTPLSSALQAAGFVATPRGLRVRA
jgi:ATP-dependent Lhr-like helicase